MLLFNLFVQICVFWYIQINLALFYSKGGVTYLFLYLAITQLSKPHIGIHQENKWLSCVEIYCCKLFSKGIFSSKVKLDKGSVGTSPNTTEVMNWESSLKKPIYWFPKVNVKCRQIHLPCRPMDKRKTESSSPKEDKLKHMAGQLYLFLFHTCKKECDKYFILTFKEWCIKSRYLVYYVSNLWGGWGMRDRRKLNDESFPGGSFFLFLPECSNIKCGTF